MAAAQAPNLWRLHIQVYSRPFLRSLAFLSQIQELSLEQWNFPTSGEEAELDCLSGLQSLETLRLCMWLTLKVEEEQASAL